MPSVRVDTQDLAALKGSTAQKVLARCANEVKHWKVPSNLSPEARVACDQVLRDINHCFVGYATAVALNTPQPNPVLEKLAESAGKF